MSGSIGRRALAETIGTAFLVVAVIGSGIAASRLSPEGPWIGGGGLWLGEVVATFGLALVVFGVLRSGSVGVTPFAVGAYVSAAYSFTSSTSFAQPGGHGESRPFEYLCRHPPVLGAPVRRLPARGSRDGCRSDRGSVRRCQEDRPTGRGSQQGEWSS